MTGPKLDAVVVDHWPLVRLGVSQALEAAGVSVVAEADCGSEGVQAARQTDSDLIVLSDGTVDEVIDLTRAAKSLPGSPKVIALLSQANRQELFDLLDAGADATVLRSVTADDLVGTVKSVLEGERVIGPAFLRLIVDASVVEEDRSVTIDDPDQLLTTKQRAVLAQLATGATNQQIAAALFVTMATVKTHLAHIYARLEVANRHEAVSRAVALGLLG